MTERAGYRWVILSMASLGILGAMGLGRFGYSAVLPSMQKALGLSGAAAGSLASWNLAGYTALALVGGFLASRFGPRVVITIGLAVTALGMALTGLSHSLLAASAARLLTGIGTGMVIAPSIALMAAWFDRRRLGLASAIAATSAGWGLVLVGPVVPVILADSGADGWRLAWYFFAAITVVLCALAGFVLRNGRRRRGSVQPADEASVLSGLKSIVRSRYAWHLGLVYFFFGFAFMTYMTFFQKRLISDMGLSSAAAGTMFLAAGISSAVFGLFYGVFSDRFGRARAILLTQLVEAAAAFLFAFRPGVAGLAVSAVIFGSCAFTVPGLMGAACGERFGPRLAPASLGFVTAFIGLGQALGPFAGGALADAVSSYGPTYLMSGCMFLVAGLAALFLGGRRLELERLHVASASSCPAGVLGSEQE